MFSIIVNAYFCEWFILCLLIRYLWFFSSVGRLGTMSNLQEKFKRPKTHIWNPNQRIQPRLLVLVFVPIRRDVSRNQRPFFRPALHELAENLTKWRESQHSEAEFRQFRLGQLCRSHLVAGASSRRSEYQQQQQHEVQWHVYPWRPADREVR